MAGNRITSFWRFRKSDFGFPCYSSVIAHLVLALRDRQGRRQRCTAAEGARGHEPLPCGITSSAWQPDKATWEARKWRGSYSTMLHIQAPTTAMWMAQRMTLQISPRPCSAWATISTPFCRSSTMRARMILRGAFASSLCSSTPTKTSMGINKSKCRYLPLISTVFLFFFFLCNRTRVSITALCPGTATCGRNSW